MDNNWDSSFQSSIDGAVIDAKVNISQPPFSHTKSSSKCGPSESVDHILQARIDRIYTRLKKTDGNIKSMQSLLRSHDGKVKDFMHNSNEPVSASSFSSLQIFCEDGLTGQRLNRAKSVDCLVPPVMATKSLSVEYLQQLTQSVQDLHESQQRFHDDLRVEVLTRNRADSVDVVKDVFESLIQKTEESSAFRTIFDKLIEIQQDFKAEQSNGDRNRVITVIEDLKREVELLRYRSLLSPRVSNNTSTGVIESNERGAETLGSGHGHLRMKAKMNKITRKLKAKIGILKEEKERVQSSYFNLEEKCRNFSSERSVLIFQADELHAKLRLMTEDRDYLKREVAMESEKRIKEEKNKEKLELMNEFTEKSMNLIKSEFQKINLENEKLAAQLGILREQNSDLTLKLEKSLLENSLSAKLNAEFKDSQNSCGHHTMKNNIESHLEDIKSHLQVLIDYSLELKEIIKNINKPVNDQNRSELGVQSLVELLKKQVSDAQAHLTTVQVDYKNLSIEKDRIYNETSRLQFENNRLQKRYEEILKSFHDKNEDCAVKNQRLRQLQSKLRNLSRVAFKMECEYKDMLHSINSKIEKVMCAWNATSVASLNVDSGLSAQHPKVLYVDIQGKLNCMMDGLNQVPRGIHFVESNKVDSSTQYDVVTTASMCNEDKLRKSDFHVHQSESGSSNNQLLVIPNSITNKIKLNLTQKEQVNSTAIAGSKLSANVKGELLNFFPVDEPSVIENAECGNLSCPSSITDLSDVIMHQ